MRNFANGIREISGEIATRENTRQWPIQFEWKKVDPEIHWQLQFITTFSEFSWLILVACKFHWLWGYLVVAIVVHLLLT